MDGVVDLDLAALEAPFDRRQDQLIELMAAIVRRLDTVEEEVKALHAELGGPAVGARMAHMEHRLDEVLDGLARVMTWAATGPSLVEPAAAPSVRGG